MDLTHTVRDVALMGAIAFYLWMGIAGLALIGLWLWSRRARPA